MAENMASGVRIVMLAEGITSIEQVEEENKNEDKVQEINLHSNRLSCMNGLRRFCNVIHVNLSSNDIEEMSPIQLAPLVHLQHLDLSANRLKRVDGLATLTNLKRLLLAHNAISSLSGFEVIHGPRYNLEFVDLRNNQLNSFRELRSMHGCIKLKSLQLSSRQKGNSICLHKTYAQRVRACLPQAELLDEQEINGKCIKEPPMLLEDELAEEEAKILAVRTETRKFIEDSDMESEKSSTASDQEDEKMGMEPQINNLFDVENDSLDTPHINSVIDRVKKQREDWSKWKKDHESDANHWGNPSIDPAYANHHVTLAAERMVSAMNHELRVENLETRLALLTPMFCQALHQGSFTGPQKDAKQDTDPEKKKDAPHPCMRHWEFQWENGKEYQNLPPESKNPWTVEEGIAQPKSCCGQISKENGNTKSKSPQSDLSKKTILNPRRSNWMDEKEEGLQFRVSVREKTRNQHRYWPEGERDIEDTEELGQEYYNRSETQHEKQKINHTNQPRTLSNLELEQKENDETVTYVASRNRQLNPKMGLMSENQHGHLDKSIADNQGHLRNPHQGSKISRIPIKTQWNKPKLYVDGNSINTTNAKKATLNMFGKEWNQLWNAPNIHETQKRVEKLVERELTGVREMEKELEQLREAVKGWKSTAEQAVHEKDVALEDWRQEKKSREELVSTVESLKSTVNEMHKELEDHKINEQSNCLSRANLEDHNKELEEEV